jgi:hypothetical protein
MKESQIMSMKKGGKSTNMQNYGQKMHLTNGESFDVTIIKSSLQICFIMKTL